MLSNRGILFPNVLYYHCIQLLILLAWSELVVGSKTLRPAIQSTPDRSTWQTSGNSTDHSIWTHLFPPFHAGPKLLMSSLSRCYHVIGLQKSVRSTTQACVTCWRITVRPQPQMLGQLLMEWVIPDSVFDRVGVDYAGPVYVKYGYIRKPTVIKSYICMFVFLSVKTVQLELVSDLSTDAFRASLRRFTARQGKPTLIWSDHGSNFVGAARELKELAEFLGQQKM